MSSYTGRGRYALLDPFNRIGGLICGPETGVYYESSAGNGGAHSTLTGAADRLDLSPAIFQRDLNIDRIAARVTTGVGAATVKLLIYYADPSTGWPDVKAHETAALDASVSSTTVEGTVSFRFEAGRLYWVGIRHSSTAAMQAVALSNTPSLGLSSVSASNHYTVLRRTLTYATAATTPWAYVNTDKTANVAPTAIRFRAA
jgi:hypothetical protein